MIELQILGCGTSTGVPMAGCQCSVCTSGDPYNSRSRTSAVIKSGQSRILIDTSTDLRSQALATKLNRVDAVIYTHAHADHILGLEDLRAYNFLQKAPIPCYGMPETLLDLRRTFSYIFNPDPDYPGGQLAQIDLRQFEAGDTIEICGLKIKSFPLIHGLTKVVGFRIGNLAYATDCKEVPSESRLALSGVDCLILDGLRDEEHRTHLTISQAIELSQELGIPRTILTHMSHTVDYRTVSKRLPAGVELAYDGMTIEVSN